MLLVEGTRREPARTAHTRLLGKFPREISRAFCDLRLVAGQMRIGFLIPEFPGQTHIFFWREMNALRELGFNPEVVSTRRPAGNIVSHTWAAEAQRDAVYLAPPNVKMAMGAAFTSLSAGPKRWMNCLRAIAASRGTQGLSRLRMMALLLAGTELAHLARRRGWTHLHVHSCANSAFIAMFAHLISGIPYSLTLHGPLSMYGPGQEMKWGHAAFGIAVTRRLRDEIASALPAIPLDRLDVAAMGVDLRVFKRSMAYNPPEPTGQCRIVSCGRLHNGKGHQDLIEALSIIRARGRQATLTLLGEGPARGDLEALISRLGLQDAVRLAGAVSEESVRDELESAHIFALASHDEAIGVATMEAMSMSLPVVVTDVGGVRELVREGVDGLFVPPRSPAALAAAIDHLCEDSSLSRRLGLAARERVERSFTSDVSARIIARRLGANADPAVDEHAVLPQSNAMVWCREREVRR